MQAYDLTVTRILCNLKCCCAYLSYFRTPTQFTFKGLDTNTRNELFTHCKHRKECKCFKEMLISKPVWKQWKQIKKYHVFCFRKIFGQQKNGHSILIELNSSNMGKNKQINKTPHTKENQTNHNKTRKPKQTKTPKNLNKTKTKQKKPNQNLKKQTKPTTMLKQTNQLQPFYYHTGEITTGYFQVTLKTPNWFCYNSFNTFSNMFKNDWTEGKQKWSLYFKLKSKAHKTNFA